MDPSQLPSLLLQMRSIESRSLSVFSLLEFKSTCNFVIILALWVIFSNELTSSLLNLVPGLRVETPRHVKVINIPIEDEDCVDLSPLWTPVFRAIDEEKRKGGRLLLLCAMGISRSASFAIGYLMCVERMTLHDAYKHVQHCRNIVCPNVGFFRQLIELEEKFYGKTTVRIIEPIENVFVADVVWNELYDDMIAELRQSGSFDMSSLRESLEDSRRSSAVTSPADSPPSTASNRQSSV